MFSQEMEPGIVVKELSPEELTQILESHFNKAFENRADAAVTPEISEEAKAQIKQRRIQDSRYRLRLGIFVDGEIAGWHYGYSTDAETYYMQNSAVLKEFRGKKLYSKLLTATLEVLKQQGFQVVTSIHHPNNPAVLIPKLKQGFVISGTLLHERFRFLVELKYFYNSARRQAFNRNIGLDI